MPDQLAPRPREALLPRLARAARTLTPEGRLAAFASFGLFLTMLLPWYQQNAVVSARTGEPLVSQDLNAFAVFSFVEAAVLLVAIAVLVLLFVRAEGASFHLPGGDGTVVMGAGLWAALLLVWRLFDKPGITTRGVAANVGIQWGIFFALAAAGVLALAGSRMRRAAQHREAPFVERRPSRPREPAPPGTTSTRVLPPERPQSQASAPSDPTLRADDPGPSASRRRARPAVPEDQLTIPLGGDPPATDEER